VQGSTGTAYRDHPCSSKETELQVTVAGAISAPRYDLEQLKAKADEMKAARLQRGIADCFADTSRKVHARFKKERV
jgi:hypothetical protein